MILKLFVNFLACAIKNPDKYNLINTSVTPNAKKTFNSLHQIFSNIGRRSEKWYGENAIEKGEIAQYDTVISNWCLSENVTNEIHSDVSWETLKLNLIGLLNWILPNQKGLQTILESYPPYQIDVECGIEEVIRSLQNVIEPEEPTEHIQAPLPVTNTANAIKAKTVVPWV